MGAATPPTRRVALQFALDGKAFPLPLVHGSVGGEPTWMLVDTGANSHVIAGWLARKAGLTLESHGDVGTDHTGREIRTSRAPRPAMTIDGWGALDDGPVLVAEVPAPIEKLGIGAFVSPQGLGDGFAVVLNLRGRQMYLADYEGAERTLPPSGRRISPRGGLACTDTESPVKGLAYVVPAEVEGQRAMLLVDTGAERTDVLAGSSAAATLLPRSTVSKERLYAASGRIRTKTVKGARLTVGDWSGVGDVDVVPGTPDPYCPRDGAVSMNMLGACTLVLGPGKMAGVCEAP